MFGLKLIAYSYYDADYLAVITVRRTLLGWS